MPAADELGNPALVERLRGEISSQGPLSFARFMEIALYHPGHGYYARGPMRLGRGGDFFTASDVGPAFGRCIARQLREVDARCGPFAPFHVFEFGAGRGLLARDVVDALAESAPDLRGRLHYTMIDRSAAMRSAAAALVPEARSVEPREAGPASAGCVLAVELFDALPVERVRRRSGALVEVRVGLDESGGFVEVETPAGDPTRRIAERYGAAAEEGFEAEVAPGLPAQLEAMAACIDRGALVIIDYGDRAARLYGPARPGGTLLAYHAHATGQRYLERVGEQDLTAHVNFTALEDAATEIGLEVLGYTTQDRFLVANGITETFVQTDLSESMNPLRVKQRLQAMQLIQPDAMGRRFKVLVLGKGLDPRPELEGLRDPFAR